MMLLLLVSVSLLVLGVYRLAFFGPAYYFLEPLFTFLEAFISFLSVFAIFCFVYIENSRNLQEKEVARTKSRLDALQLQMNPHFIANALNALSMHVISIEDDGVGFDERELPADGWTEGSKRHIGISNTEKQLKLMCTGRLTIHCTAGRGTVCEISIPKLGS